MLMKLSLATVVATFGWVAVASADSIDPASYSADLAVGESVTIRKTVVVSAGDPTGAKVDVHFLMDTSGSMGGVINTAKSAAASLFTEINSFGDVAGGVGVFSEGAYLPGETFRTAPGLVINSDINTNSATTIAAINAISLGNPDGGGDFPESGWTAIAKAGENLSWRTGSTRFMFLFTDASAKGDLEGAKTALADNDIELITLSYGNLGTITASYGDPTIPGGTVVASSTNVEELIEDILEGISGGFSEYGEVTVDDLDMGMPAIGVSTVCVSADVGACDGATAVGEYDRSVDRTFEFDVTFTRLAEGDAVFDTHALVDRGIVATERDSFTGGGVPPIPLPAAGWLMLAGLGSLVVARRRKA